MFENLYAMIENTTICGANCIMCPRNKFSHKFENMPFDTFKKIIDELVGGGVKKSEFVALVTVYVILVWKRNWNM